MQYRVADLRAGEAFVAVSASRREILASAAAGAVAVGGPPIFRNSIFIISSFSSLSSYRNCTNKSLSSNSRQQYLSQQFPPPSQLFNSSSPASHESDFNIILQALPHTAEKYKKHTQAHWRWSWVFIKGGCSGRGVQWMGVVSCSKLVHKTIQITTPCFHCTPLCGM